MSSQALTQFIPEKLSFVNLPRISLRKFWVLGVLLIIFLLAFYIFQINSITRAGFLVSQHKESIVELSQHNKDLEIGFYQTNYLVNLENVLSKFDYEKVKKVHYIRVLDGTVVAK